MDAAGTDFQVVSHTRPAQPVALARKANAALAREVASHPGHLAGLAIPPLVEPEAAAEELERAIKTLGLRGALIKRSPKGASWTIRFRVDAGACRASERAPLSASLQPAGKSSQHLLWWARAYCWPQTWPAPPGHGTRTRAPCPAAHRRRRFQLVPRLQLSSAIWAK
jgi:hypothetical protein